MKKFIAFFLLLSTYTFAQDGKGKITGTITDAASKEVVEFATIALVTSDGKTIDGAVADMKGKFTLNKIAPGSYKLVVSFVGYETKSVDVEITDKKDQLDLNIAISSEAKVLSEVVVEGQRSTIEERVDRTIYNAENDATTRGGDATDVLKRVPMLSVDFDGNVSLRGSQNILVLINNKPSTIMASSVADALKQIPAEQIKTVEVITSPSAKYDAEGTGGIINIITKKNTLEGVTLNINSSAGIRGSNLGLNGNYRRGKLGLSLGGWGRTSYNVKGAYYNEQLIFDPENISPDRFVRQRGNSRNQNLFGNYTLGFDYDINKYNSLTGSFRTGVRNGRNKQNGLFRETFVDDVFSGSELSRTKSMDKSQNFDFNLTYTRTFDKPQKELSILGMYSRNNRNNEFRNLTEEVDGIFDPRGLKNLNDSYNQEVTVQVDYATPINANQQIEFGAKSIMRQVYSNFNSFTDPEGDGTYDKIENAQNSNNLNYDQNVTAGYLAYTLNTANAIGFKAGARYEYTTIDAFTRTESNIEIPSYGVLVPSVNVSKRIKNTTLKAGYNRRVQRPSIQFLNPYKQYSNPLNVSVGNPQLDPEFTNNFELSVSTGFKSTSINLSSFVRNTNNGIQRVREPDPFVGDTIYTTFRNIGKERAYGLNLFVNIMLGKLTLNGGGDAYYLTLGNNDSNPTYTASNKGWVYNGRFFGNYQLKNDWAIQFFSHFRGRQVQLQGKQSGFGMYSLAIAKNFKNKRGSIGFGAENFFAPSMKMRNELNTYNISQSGYNEMFNRNFKVNFSYRIGKMSFDQQRPRRSRRSINNDDLKDGGGMDMGGMEGQQMNNNGGGGMQRGAMPQVRPQTAPVQVPTAPTDTVYQAAGTWVYTVEGGQPGAGGKLTLVKDGETYSGSIKSDRMPQEVQLSKVTVDGNNITFAYTMSFGGNEVVIDCTAVIIENEMTGTMNIGQFRSMPIKATRQ